MATLISILPCYNCASRSGFIDSSVYIILLAVHALMISESETQSRNEARGCGMRD